MANPPPDPSAPSTGSSTGNYGAGANGSLAVNPQLLGTLATELPGLGANPTVDDVVQAFEKAPEQVRAQIQGLLYSGGFYPSTYTPLIGGVIRTEDRDAFASAVVISVQSGEAVPDYLTSAVQAAQSVGSTSGTKAAQPPAVIEPGIVAPGVQSTGGHYTLRLTSPQDLAFVSDTVAQKLLGRNATGAEKNAITQSFQQFQTDQQNTEIAGSEQSRLDTFNATAGARNDQFNANVANRNAQFNADVTKRNAQSGRPPGDTANMSVPQAIMSATGDPRVQLAMMMGSHMEGGWGPNYTPGDSGGSTGPFQINHNNGMHSDISVADTLDPVKATQYMLGEYQKAAAKVPDSLWQSDPKAAAEQAAVLAERPAEPYHVSQGQGAVDNAFSAATGVLNSVAAAGTSADAGPGSAAGDAIRNGYATTGQTTKPGQAIGSLVAPAIPDASLPDVKLPDNFVPGSTTTVTNAASPDAYATEAYKFADPNEYAAHTSANVYGMILNSIKGAGRV